MNTKDLNHIVEEGRTYCREIWLNSSDPTASQDVNPYDRKTQPEEFLMWEAGFWDELRRYMIGIMQPRN